MSLLLLTISIAVLNTLVPLWLSHASLPTWQIGLISSSYFTGNLVGTLLSEVLIKRFGFTRSYYMACLLFALTTVALGLAGGFLRWLLLRFLAGVACALIWMMVESALMRSGTVHTRGRLLSAYMMIYYLGTVVGQLLISGISTALTAVLPWAVSLMVSAILPLWFAPLALPSASAPQITLWPMLLRCNARLGVKGCIISGIVLGSLYSLMPLYLSHLGLSDDHIGYWIALLVSAGILGQWPVGRLVDRYGRLMVLWVLVFMVILGSLAVLSHAAMAAALFVLGCSCFTLYPVAMSWAYEKASQNELVAMNQALLLSYTFGSLFDPSMTAILMQHYSRSSTVCHNCSGGTGVLGDAAAQTGSPPYAGGHCLRSTPSEANHTDDLASVCAFAPSAVKLLFRVLIRRRRFFLVPEKGRPVTLSLLRAGWLKPQRQSCCRILQSVLSTRRCAVDVGSTAL